MLGPYGRKQYPIITICSLELKCVLDVYVGMFISWQSVLLPFQLTSINSSLVVWVGAVQFPDQQQYECSLAKPNEIPGYPNILARQTFR